MNIGCDTKLYVVTRSDLPPGARAAQAVHAALQFALVHLDQALDWSLLSNNVVVLEAVDEPALEALWERAAGTGDLYGVQFREPDLADQLTALALLGPSVPHCTSQLPLALRAA